MVEKDKLKQRAREREERAEKYNMILLYDPLPVYAGLSKILLCCVPWLEFLC